MSKFNNPARALAPTRPALSVSPAMLNRPPDGVGVAPPPDKPAPLPTSLKERRESILIPLGFVSLTLLMFSGVINDWGFLTIGSKAYVSTVMTILVPAIWLISGNAPRGLKDNLGKLWLGLVIFMIIGVPFSVWRSASTALLGSYLLRSLCLYFYISSFVTTLERCRRMILVNVAFAAAALLTCIKFGSVDMDGDARFRVPGSIFLGNSNDLGLQMAIGLTAFIFLFYFGGVGRRMAGIVGILASLLYMLKTGSRGCLLAIAAMVLVATIISKRRLMVAVLIIPSILITSLFIPSGTIRRFKLLFQGNTMEGLDESSYSAMESQFQRQHLLMESVRFTFQHPLTGVGAGQFGVALTGDAAKEGKWAAFLGTHNSYTQVSSECGIPAFLCYFGVIVICFRRSYWLYKQSAGKPKLQTVEAISFCLLCGTIVYAVATFFFHMAYTGLLPILSGQVMALTAAAKPLLNPTLPGESA